MSYNSIKRIDADLAKHIVDSTGFNRVPLPPTIEKPSPLNGAMDNFDRNESTLSGSGSTYNFYPTTIILTPILPYPATTYDSIFTTMVNYQDALRQKGDVYGGLWADQGVYCIAKETQLPMPDKFYEIFLGLGGFYMEKNYLGLCWIVSSCIWNCTDTIARTLPVKNSSADQDLR